MIDHDTCVSCGICHKSCPYPRDCIYPRSLRRIRPVKAISKDEHGVEHIDESKCIYCGKCMNACPFGAIFEISQTFDVLQHIKKGRKVGSYHRSVYPRTVQDFYQTGIRRL